ncbi:MAG: class I SAM-dependent methyltransferase [Eikenella sp.]|nr:class I SAM-dependent methyltransferase [Eikenella sp.]
MTRLDNILPFAHRLWAAWLPEGGCAVDATAGNGHDTLRLAQLAGESGRVYAFDVQEAALVATRARLQAAGVDDGRVCLVAAGHERLADYVAQAADVAAFNCGYLPGGDKNRTTQTDTTLRALAQALAVLKPGGLLTVVLYPGHAEGTREAEAVRQWLSALPQQDYAVLHYGFLNRRNRPPYLLAVEKLAAAYPATLGSVDT